MGVAWGPETQKNLSTAFFLTFFPNFALAMHACVEGQVPDEWNEETKRIIFVKSIYIYMAIALLGLLASCSSSKFVPEKQYLLEAGELRSDQRELNISQLEPYVRQKANSKWFSIFKIPLGTYALSGRDTTKWINRTLQRLARNL
jgi:hypothetical protein